MKITKINAAIIESLYGSINNDETAFMMGDTEESWIYNSAAVISSPHFINYVPTLSFSGVETVSNSKNLSLSKYDFIFKVKSINHI